MLRGSPPLQQPPVLGLGGKWIPLLILKTMTVKELKDRYSLKSIKLVKPNKDTAWVANIVGPNNVEVVAWVTKATPLDAKGRPEVDDSTEVNSRLVDVVKPNGIIEKEARFFIGVFNTGIDSFEV